MSNGDTTERELVNRLEDTFGLAAMRAPGSGGATARDLPDVIAGTPKRIPNQGFWTDRSKTYSNALAFEVKKSSGDPVYVEKEEAYALVRFAESFGATPYIAVRWKSNKIRDTEFYLRHPFNCHESEKYYRAKREDCVERWETLTDVIRSPQ